MRSFNFLKLFSRLTAVAGLLLCCCFMATAQAGGELKGQVYDEAGAPVIGASVIATNTATNFSAGAQTDSLGVFKFVNLPEGGPYSFSFSSVGYEELTLSGYIITADANISLLAKLKSATGSMDEVVVVGYGTKRKINLSGAVQSVSGEALQSRSITNINSGLQGLIANLNITPASGRATDAATFNIRGITGLGTSASPLILVDNVPITASELSRLNPADIENVSILKDAGSAAIYGARAAYGVVLITTKTAKGGNIQINADVNYGLKTRGVGPDIVTDPLTVMQYKHDAATPLYNLYPEAEMAYAREIAGNPSLPRVIVNPNNANAWAYYGSTNWMEEAYKKFSPALTGNVSVAKKDDKLAYYFSAGYYEQNGALRYGNDIMKRYNLRGNASFQITKWMSLGTNTTYTYREYDTPSFLDGDFFWNVNRTPSLSVPRNPDGTWTSDGASILGALQDGGRGQYDLNDFQTTINTEINLWKKYWTLKADATYKRANETGRRANLPVFYRTGPGQPLQSRLTAGVGSNSFATNIENAAKMDVYNIYTDFHKAFGKHFISALVGYNQEYRYYHDFSVTRAGLISQNLPSPQLATGTVTQNDFIADYALRGFFNRLNYIYNDKYIIEFNSRADGTSRFPSYNRWGFFPSASAAWVVSKESFFEAVKDVARISFFKLRASYGTLGNQVLNDNLKLGNYNFFDLMPARQISTILDGTLPTAVYMPARYISPSQTWEEATTLNFGTDISFFKNKLEFNFDWYTRDTKGLLARSKTLPAVFGIEPPTTNSVDIRTKGWELTAAWRDNFDVAGNPLNLSIRAVLSNSKSIVTRYDNPTGILSDYRVGQRFGDIWGLTTDGFIQNEEELAAIDQTQVGSDDQQYKFYVGDIKFKDLNGDRKITFGDNTEKNPGDRRIIGNNTIQYPYGIDINAGWKGIDLRIFLQGVGKRDWYPNPSNIYFWGVYAQPWTNVIEQNMDRWSPETPNGYYPRLKSYIAEDASELGYPQTRYLQNASYLRFKTISLGYSLPNSIISRWKLAGMRFYVSGENIFTIQHLKAGMDPEGLNGSIYPYQKTYSAGLNINL